jgi:hypothetical protein
MAFVSDNLQNFSEQVQTAFPDLALETVDSNFV